MNNLEQLLASVANFSEADLTQALAVANAAGDTVGAQCYQTLLNVQAQITKVWQAANPGGGTMGVFTVAEIISLVTPNSPEAQALELEIISGCSAKVVQVQADWAQLIANGLTLAGIVLVPAAAA